MRIRIDLGGTKTEGIALSENGEEMLRNAGRHQDVGWHKRSVAGDA